MNLAPLLTGPGRSRRPADVAATLAFVVGGGLIIWSAAIHLDLWNSGYRSIATIGNLFMAQFVGGLLVGLLVIAVRRVWAAIIGIGFGVSTIGGFLLSVQIGLFNFKESWNAPFAKEAFGIEIAIVIVMAVAGALCLVRSAPSSTRTTTTTPVGTSS